MSKFQGKLRGNCQEGVVVESFLIVVRRGDVLLEKLMKLF